jgi:hypothetical protein
VPECCGIEHVHIRIRGQERVHDRPLEAVSGAEQGRDPILAARAGQIRFAVEQLGDATGVAGVDGRKELRTTGDGPTSRSVVGTSSTNRSDAVDWCRIPES